MLTVTKKHIYLVCSRPCVRFDCYPKVDKRQLLIVDHDNEIEEQLEDLGNDATILKSLYKTTGKAKR